MAKSAPFQDASRKTAPRLLLGVIVQMAVAFLATTFVPVAAANSGSIVLLVILWTSGLGILQGIAVRILSPWI